MRPPSDDHSILVAGQSGGLGFEDGVDPGGFELGFGAGLGVSHSRATMLFLMLGSLPPRPMASTLWCVPVSTTVNFSVFVEPFLTGLKVQKAAFDSFLQPFGTLSNVTPSKAEVLRSPSAVAVGPLLLNL